MAIKTITQLNDKEELVQQMLGQSADIAGGFITVLFPALNGYYWQLEALAGNTDLTGQILFESPVGTTASIFRIVSGTPLFLHSSNDVGHVIGDSNQALNCKLPATAAASLVVIARQKPIRNYNFGVSPAPGP